MISHYIAPFLNYRCGALIVSIRLPQSGQPGLELAATLAYKKGSDRGEVNAMKHREPISKIMASNPKTINGATKISEAAALFAELGVHHLPVVSGKKLIGIFSYSDLLRLDFSSTFNQDIRQVYAVLDTEKSMEDVMATDLKTLTPHQTVRDAAELLSSGKFHSLPVVDENNNLCGIVTSSDLIRFLADLY